MLYVYNYKHTGYNYTSALYVCVLLLIHGLCSALSSLVLLYIFCCPVGWFRFTSFTPKLSFPIFDSFWTILVLINHLYDFKSLNRAHARFAYLSTVILAERLIDRRLEPVMHSFRINQVWATVSKLNATH